MTDIPGVNAKAPPGPLGLDGLIKTLHWYLDIAEQHDKISITVHRVMAYEVLSKLYRLRDLDVIDD